MIGLLRTRRLCSAGAVAFSGCSGGDSSAIGASADITRSGGKVTMTAVPDQGSNSAEYAPQTKSITWSYPGRRVSGCGPADLSCTVVAAAKATTEWQWGLFHVTMPRTFFINSRGSNCAGQVICAGFATNAWAFAGVPLTLAKTCA